METSTSGKKKWLLLGAMGLCLGGLMVPVKPDTASPPRPPAPTMDLSKFSADKPARPLRLLFIHHSVGGHLLAEKGPEKERANCILDTHENGGGLRKKLQAQGYEIHEASYGSEVGDKTDLFDWKPKFQSKMDRILAVDENDKALGAGKKNDVVMFKSCYPNSRFVGEGQAPGNPAGPELTVWNARAAFSSLLEDFKKHPETLYVYLTAPPDAPPGPERAFKVLMKKLLGKGGAGAAALEQGRLARMFNAWIVSPEGWLKDYPLKNVVVYDFYDALTDNGRSDMLRYPTGDGTDSHPSSEGNTRAGEPIPALVNRAVRRAGLSD